MRLIGIVLIVLGVVMLVFGINETDSFASEVSEFFTGNPTDRAIWLMIGGIAAILVGLGGALMPNPPRVLTR